MTELTPCLAGALNDGLKQLVTQKIQMYLLLSPSQTLASVGKLAIAVLLKFAGDIALIVTFPYEFVSFLLTDRFG
jgi:hypothetical protein